jgi:hypothetical protein
MWISCVRGTFGGLRCASDRISGRLDARASGCGRTLAYIINSSSSSSGRWRICFFPHGTGLSPAPGEEDAIVFSTSSSSTCSSPSPADRNSPPPTGSLASEGTCRLTRRELALDLRRPTPPPARGVDSGGCSRKAESSRSGSRSSSSSSFTGTSMNAWTRRTTRGSGALVGECRGLLSTRAVDEDADACRFVAEDVADESPPALGMLGMSTGTRFGVLLSCASVLCRRGKRCRTDDEGARGGRTCDDGADSCWLRRRVCLASTRRNWSFQALISSRSVSSRRRHWSFHCCASWRSWLTSSAWWVFCTRRGEGGSGVRWTVCHNSASEYFTTTDALFAWDECKQSSMHKGVERQEAAHLRLPLVHFRDPDPLARIEISERIVALAPEDTEIVLDLA